jgi:hypothetical protein
MMSEKILERIRRLMAMAGDATSPNEAAIALRRARLLMDQHQITELDLKKEHADNLGVAKIVYFDQWSGRLALQLAKLNDCVADIAQGDAGLPVVQFKGFLVDAVTCQEMFPYLVAVATRGTKGMRKQADKLGYYYGFASGIAEQVAAILAERKGQRLGDGRSLVIVKTDLVKSKFGEQRYGSSSKQQVNQATYASGVQAGRNTSLHRQVGGTPQRRLK